MILKNVKVECVDPQTGLVLKRITTSENSYLNRKLAVNNSIMNSEVSRITAKKSVFPSPAQVYHIRYDDKLHYWVTKGISAAKEHANKQNRLFLPFEQRSEGMWDALT